MTGNIVKKIIKGKTYHYYQETWREKIDTGEIGKTRGTGKSRVRSKSYYLGTAQQIFDKMRGPRQPDEATHRAFGFEAALLQTAREIGLVDILRENIPGKRFGIERWKYFLKGGIYLTPVATIYSVSLVFSPSHVSPATGKALVLLKRHSVAADKTAFHGSGMFVG